MQIRTDHHHKLIFHEAEWNVFKWIAQQRKKRLKLNLCKFFPALHWALSSLSSSPIIVALCKRAIEMEFFDGAYQLHNSSHDAFLRPKNASAALHFYNLRTFSKKLRRCALELNFSSEIFTIFPSLSSNRFSCPFRAQKKNSGSWIIWVTVSVTRLRTFCCPLTGSKALVVLSGRLAQRCGRKNNKLTTLGQLFSSFFTRTFFKPNASRRASHTEPLRY